MIDIFSKALNETIQVDRIIGKLVGKEDGPTVVFFGGIHGNETAGVFALTKAFEKINQDILKGKIYGISGNLKALKEKQFKH